MYPTEISPLPYDLTEGCLTRPRMGLYDQKLMGLESHYYQSTSVCMGKLDGNGLMGLELDGRELDGIVYASCFCFQGKALTRRHHMHLRVARPLALGCPGESPDSRLSPQS